LEDRRKNNGGHKSAGRKPKADEIKLIESMDAILVPEAVWKALAAKVVFGDVQATKTWLSYRFGLPKQSIDHTTDGKEIENTTIINLGSGIKPE
jgi:hypothetical protein